MLDQLARKRIFFEFTFSVRSLSIQRPGYLSSPDNALQRILLPSTKSSSITYSANESLSTRKATSLNVLPGRFVQACVRRQNSHEGWSKKIIQFALVRLAMYFSEKLPSIFSSFFSLFTKNVPNIGT